MAPSDVMLVMGFTVLGLFSTILSLSLFITVVGTLSRMYRDSEMVIWFRPGGPDEPSGAAAAFSWPVLLVICSAVARGLALGQPADQGSRPNTNSAAMWTIAAPGEFQGLPTARACSSSTRTPDAHHAANNVFIATREQRQAHRDIRPKRAPGDTQWRKAHRVAAQRPTAQTAPDKPGLRIPANLPNTAP